MEPKKEQALVGLFVLVVAGLLVVTVLSLQGAFTRAGVPYRSYFKFAGGLEPGAAVRYGGIKAGRVESLRVDPQDSTRIEIRFSVRPDIPVKTDSKAKITSISPLGDYYLEISPGGREAPRAPADSALASQSPVTFAELTDQLYDLTPKAQLLIQTLSDRATELKQTIARVNDVLSDQNRADVSASLAQLRGMLEENRPKLKATMTNVETVSAKAGPLLDDFESAAQRADQTLAHLDSMLGENREDVHKAVIELRETLASATKLVGQLNRTLEYNSENIDDIVENIRITTENLKQFTDTIKTRPYTLIRTSSPREHQPGEAQRH